MRYFLIFFCLLMLSACASIFGPSGSPPQTYDLTAPTHFPNLDRDIKAHFLISEPTALKALDNNRIVLKPHSLVIEYLLNARWSDRLPRLLQGKLIESFENTARVEMIGKPGDGLSVDYQIMIDLRAFEVQLDSKRAVVEWSAKLVSEQTGRVVKSKIFKVHIPVNPNKGNMQIVNRLNVAFSTAVRSMIKWIGATVSSLNHPLGG